MFENAVQKFEKVKTSIQEKWQGFKKKFEGTKGELSQEVMKAETPEDLIVLGKKLQEQGEALKVEQGALEKEEAESGEKHETDKRSIVEADQEEANEMHENKELAGVMAEEYDQEIETQKAEAKQLEMDKQQQAAKDTAEAEAILKKLHGGEAEAVPDATSEQPKVESAELVQHESIEKNRTFQDLKVAFSEMHRPGRFDADASERSKRLSKELVPQLTTIEDIREAEFYMETSDRQVVWDKWNKLSQEQIQKAKTAEEIIDAFDNVRPNGSAAVRLREMASKKLYDLVGKDKYNSIMAEHGHAGYGSRYY